MSAALQFYDRTTILKSDHFPSGKRVFALRISGSPNYRKVPFARVYGVAQPTAWCIRAILNHLGSGRGGHRGRRSGEHGGGQRDAGPGEEAKSPRHKTEVCRHSADLSRCRR